MTKDQYKIGLLVEMCWYGHLEEVKKLISEGVDVNAVADNGYTPLKAAQEEKNEQIIEFLLSVGAKNNLEI